MKKTGAIFCCDHVVCDGDAVFVGCQCATAIDELGRVELLSSSRCVFFIYKEGGGRIYERKDTTGRSMHECDRNYSWMM
jgi:hypothetical protein